MQFPSGSEWTYSLLGNGLQPERKAALGSACNASQPFAPVEHVPIDLNRKVSKGVELSESMRIDYAHRSGPHAVLTQLYQLVAKSGARGRSPLRDGGRCVAGELS